MPFYDSIEWEYLQNPKKFTVIPQDLKSQKNENYHLWNTIKLRRNSRYDIECELKSYNTEYTKFDEFKNKIISNPKFEYELESNTKKLCLEFNNNNLKIFKNPHEYKFFLGISKLKFLNKTYLEDYKKEKSNFFIKEWYLNGPNNIEFNRCTTYLKQTKIIKDRKINNNSFFDNHFSHEYDTNWAEHNDFILIKTDNLPPFIIQKVPEKFNPKYSSSIGIEYLMKGNKPTKEQRYKIQKVVSFVLGKNLIKIGETIFNKKGQIIKEYCKSTEMPLSVSLESICKSKDLNPIFYKKNNHNDLSIEENLKFIIDKFFRFEKKFNLLNVIKYDLNSMIIPNESAIILIASALEDLSNYWFKNSEIKKIKNKNFKLDSSEIKILEEKLKDYPKLIKKIKNKYKESGIKKRNAFFKEYNIEIGELEQDAINYRNFIGHGGKINEKNMEKLKYLVPIYRSLLNRCIIKVLEYNVDYNDLIYDQPRSINEFIPNEITEEIKYNIEKSKTKKIKYEQCKLI